MYIYFEVLINYLRFLLKKIKNKGIFNVSKILRVSLNTKFFVSSKSNIELGYNICISRLGDVFVGNKGSLYIGDRVYFNKGVFISCQNKIHIEQNCQFGPDVKIIDNNHKFSREEGVSTKEHTYGEIYIGESSWIGANVVLLKNAKIGKRCVIGAGCVINQEIPDNSIVTLGKNNIIIEEIREKK